MAKKLIFINSNIDEEEYDLPFPDASPTVSEDSKVLTWDNTSGELVWSGHDDLEGFVANEHIDWTADQGATNINIANIDQSQIDHGSIGGLSDDDHSQYLLTDGSRDVTGLMEFSGDFSGSYTDRSIVDKAYVDAIAIGRGPKAACRVRTIDELNAIYSNGTSGVGATLTNAGTQEALSLDGVAVAVFDRVLVMDQVAEHIGNVDLSSGYTGWGTTAEAFTIQADGGTTYTVTLNTDTTDVATTVAEINAELANASPSDASGLFEAFASGNYVGIHAINPEKDRITIAAGTPSALTALGWAAGTYENFENGIYEVTNIGSGSTNWVLTRAEDYDDNPDGEINKGDLITVLEGTSHGGHIYSQLSYDSTGSDAVGTNGITFTHFSVPTDLSAGNGIDSTELANQIIQLKLDGTSNGTSGLELGAAGISISDNIAGTYLTLTDGVIDHDNSGVSADSYGSASSVATFTVDAQGHLTAAGEATISVSSSNITDFAEAAQDAVGGILTDTDEIDFTYDDNANTISATIKADAVDDTMIDWGGTGSQVNAADIPFESGHTYSGSATNVMDALEEIEASIPGSQNVFTTISGTTGTDPVADQATDTLNLSSTNGTLVISGDSVTDTMDFDIAADGIKDSHIDWGGDAGQVNAADLPFVTGNTYGGSATNTMDALEELYDGLGTISTTYNAGENITKGDLVYIADDGDINIYDIDMTEYCIGIALDTATTGNPVRVAANDTKVAGTSTISGYANPGDKVFWIYDDSGTKLSTTAPTKGGAYVWFVGVALSSTSFHIEVEYKKKNAA